MQPGWNITIQTTKYNFMDVYNAKLLDFDPQTNEATFQAWRPYLTLGKQEESIIEIMLVVEYTTAPQVRIGPAPFPVILLLECCLYMQSSCH